MKNIYLLLVFLTSFSYSQQFIVDKVDFTGAKRLNKQFLQKLIYTRPTKVLDSVELKKDVRILTRLNGITKTDFVVIKKENNLVDVQFVIIDNITLIPNFSAWNTDEIGAYRISLSESNFLGRNNEIGAFYQFNGFHSYGVDLKAPQLFNFKYGLALNLHKLVSKEPVFFSNSVANYRYANTSAELVGSYRKDFKNEFRLGFSYFNEKYEYLDGVTASNVPQFLSVNKKLLKFEYTHNQVDYFYYLASGFKSSFYFQFVLSGNQFQDKFLIGWNDFVLFKRVGKKGNWASRFRLGLSSNNNSPFAPFSVDNNLSVRGVGYIIDRGTGAIILNTEYRKTVFEKKWFVLQANAFIDSGSWRSPGGGFSDFIDSKNVRIYPGLGIRLIHKRIFNAILRVDYGYGITKNASKGFVFGVGQYF